MISSRDIADRFEKQHDKVIRDIKNILKRNPEYNDHFQIAKYVSGRGRVYYHFILDSEGDELLTNKYKHSLRSSRFETKIGNEIIDYCNQLNLHIIPQHEVLNGKYRIDFYIKSLNIAIEYDEYEHKYNTDKDIIRESEIKEKIGCDFIRISEEMSVGTALGVITNHIT